MSTTTRQSPSGPIVTEDTPLTEVWVDDVNGNDIDFAGSQIYPFKTLTKAVEATEKATGDVLIHLMPHGDEEGYDMSSLSDRNRQWSCDAFVIRGEGLIRGSELTLTAYSYTEGESASLCEFSAEAWTANEHSGYFLEGPGGELTGIQGNAADTLTAKPDTTPSVDDKFYIVSPAVALRIPCDFTSFGTYSPTTEIVGPPQSNIGYTLGNSIVGETPKCLLRFENIEFRVPDDVPVKSFDNIEFKFFGAIAIEGCQFSKNNDEDADIMFFDFVSMGGTYVGGTGRTFLGLGAVDRGGYQKPGMILSRCTAAGSFAGGPVQIQEGATYHAENYLSADDTDRKTFRGRKAAVTVDNGSVLRMDRERDHFRVVTDGDMSVWANRATFWVYGVIEQLGDNPLFYAEGFSKVMIGYGDVLDSGADRSVKLYEGSQLVMHENDFQYLGAVVLGHVAPSTRAAAPWNIGDVFVHAPVDSSKCSAIRYS